MNEANLVTRLSYLAIGDGFRKMHNVSLADLRDADGTVLTGSTVPVLAAFETYFYGLSCAANQTDMGTLTFTVPPDYDDGKDELRLRFLGNMAGGTNTAVSLLATLYVKRAATALAAKAQKTSTTDMPASATATTSAGWVEIKLDGLSLLPGDTVFAVLAADAHTTDALYVYGLDLWYRSNLAFTTVADR